MGQLLFGQSKKKCIIGRGMHPYSGDAIDINFKKMTPRLGESVECAEQVPPAAAQGEAVQVFNKAGKIAKIIGASNIVFKIVKINGVFIVIFKIVKIISVNIIILKIVNGVKAISSNHKGCLLRTCHVESSLCDFHPLRHYHILFITIQQS